MYAEYERMQAVKRKGRRNSATVRDGTTCPALFYSSLRASPSSKCGVNLFLARSPPPWSRRAVPLTAVWLHNPLIESTEEIATFVMPM